MRGLRPSERRRLSTVCWTVTFVAAVAGLHLGLSGGGTVQSLPYDDFTEPARPYWTSEQLGVVPFALPGARAPAASFADRQPAVPRCRVSTDTV